MRQIKIGETTETVIERSDYPPEKVRQVLGNETIAILGYGVQGRGQSLNMKDNGVRVIVGQRPGTRTWDAAQKDGWVPGQTLFPLEEAARRGTIVQYLLSDAGQKDFWPTLKPLLTAGKALYFSHGFSIVYGDQTGVVPPKDIDVILVAPKGSGTTVRRHFLEGKGINASFAVHQDATGRARDAAWRGHRHRLGLPVRDDVPKESSAT
jgi:Ketol-acid reductoisomerase